MERKIQIGDVVYLKSGGPAMTVTRRNMEDGSFVCGCFDSSTFLEIIAHSDALELAG